MKIAIVSRSTTHHFSAGGMETHLKNLSEGLSDLNNSVYIITTSLPEQNKVNIQKENIKKTENGVNYIFIGDTTPGLNPLSKWELFFYKIGLLKIGYEKIGQKNFHLEANKVFNDLDLKINFDVLISQSTSAKRVYTKRDVKIISIIHGTIKSEIENRLKTIRSVKNTIRLLLIDIPKWTFEHFGSNRKFYSRVDLVISVSKDLKKKFIEDYPFLSSKTVVIYNGVDTRVFYPTEKKSDENIFNILYVGRLDREKGVDVLINAIEVLSKKKPNHFMLTLVGGGVHEDEFKEMVSNLCISKQVNFVGKKINTEVAEFYRQSDLFAFPTRRNEGHPVTLSESFCCGLPVLCTRKGGLSELINEGTDGFFIREDDINYLVEKIMILDSDRELLNKLSRNAAQKGLNIFSKRSMVDGYITEIKKIL